MVVRLLDAIGRPQCFGLELRDKGVADPLKSDKVIIILG